MTSAPVHGDFLGYLGECRRPVLRTPRWSREYTAGLYRAASEHADAVLTDVGLEAPAMVPWFPEPARATTSGALLAPR